MYPFFDQEDFLNHWWGLKTRNVKSTEIVSMIDEQLAKKKELL